MSEAVHEGGCFCGAVRFAFTAADSVVANCHCSMCRRIHGAPFVTWVVVPTDAFRYTAGQAKHLASSAKGDRYFCDACGSPLACIIKERPEHIDIPTGSLDEQWDASTAAAWQAEIERIVTAVNAHVAELAPERASR